jgi:hypothetical protein
MAELFLIWSLEIAHMYLVLVQAGGDWNSLVKSSFQFNGLGFLEGILLPP